MNATARKAAITRITALTSELRALGVTVLAYDPEQLSTCTPAHLRSSINWAVGTLANLASQPN